MPGARDRDTDTGGPVDGIVGDVITAVGLAATVASTYFGYLGVRHLIRRREARAPAPTPDPAPTPVPAAPPADPAPYDVFVSYGSAESDAAERLAGRLRESGASVFLVRWVAPGLVPLLEAERALSGATLGVLLFGRGTMDDPRITDEYAVLLTRAHEGGLRFVPAPVDDVTLPAFAAIRRPVDLREPGSAHYDTEVARLVRIVRGPAA
ncbi:toll/interleukin-1 receptor domain-containing protein [Streptomyces sp. NPDC048290]|uniref:toll/interleukin-1 receptor domain-containing protein n=1 Tax=Streptomyces sp. NPDC048290 TaxID=3155811 RepID=UPI0034172B9A